MAKFKAGDIVVLKGTNKPQMIVEVTDDELRKFDEKTDMIRAYDDPCVSVMWFDRFDRCRNEELREAILELVPEYKFPSFFPR